MRFAKAGGLPSRPGVARADEPSADQRTRSCATELVCPDCGTRAPLADTAFRCPSCDKGLDIEYDYERARGRIAELRPAEPAAQHLALRGAAADRRAAAPPSGSGQFSGLTPLIRAERLGAELGLRNLYIKDDSTNRPSLSYKDRVVAMAVARALELGCSEIGCVSTGNVGTATASLGGQGRPQALRLLPGQPRAGQGARLPRARRRGLPARRQLRRGQPRLPRAGAKRAACSSPTSPCARSTRRGRRRSPSRSSSSSTGASPDHIVMPAAGGTLSSRVHKGLNELEIVGLARDRARPSSTSASRAGCSPIAKAIVENSGEIVPQVPETLAPSRWRSARPATARSSSTPSAAAAARPPPRPTARSSTAMELLAATEGVLTEPAGGTTVAATMKLAQQGVIGPDDTVVVVISGNGLKTLSEQPVRPWPEHGPLQRRRRWRKSSTTSATTASAHGADPGKPRFTYANVISTLALFLALRVRRYLRPGPGPIAAASGSEPCEVERLRHPLRDPEHPDARPRNRLSRGGLEPSRCDSHRLVCQTEPSIRRRHFSAPCTRAIRSSSRTPGTPARQRSWRGSGSRRWRAPAPASPSPSAAPTAA